MNSSPCTATETVYWVGADVAKKTFDAALLAPGQKWSPGQAAQVPVKQFGRTPKGVGEFLEWLDALVDKNAGFPLRVVMEATGRYSTELAGWMLARRPALAPAIAPPRQTAAFIESLGQRNKTDKMDAIALSFYGMERNPIPYEKPDAVQEKLRELTRYRQVLVEENVAAKNRAGEHSDCKCVVQMQKKRMGQLARDIEKIEKEIKAHIAKNPELKEDMELCCTIYGVGPVISAVVRAELGDLRRFETARQLSAYAGLNPTQCQSGTSVNKRTRMDKNGNTCVRHYLYLAACTAIRGDNDLGRTYRRMREEGKCGMSALGAIMRKMLILMRAILISGKPYDPMLKTRKLNQQGVN